MSVNEHRRQHLKLNDEYCAARGHQRIYGNDFSNRVNEPGLGGEVADALGLRSDKFPAGDGLQCRSLLNFAYADSPALERCRHADLNHASPYSLTLNQGLNFK